MNENDVLRELKLVEKADCADSDTVKEVVKKAVSLIKLQRTENDALRERNARLEEKVGVTNQSIRLYCNFSQKDLVSGINKLIFGMAKSFRNEEVFCGEVFDALVCILNECDKEKEFAIVYDRDEGLPKLRAWKKLEG